MVKVTTIFDTDLRIECEFEWNHDLHRVHNGKRGLTQLWSHSTH